MSGTVIGTASHPVDLSDGRSVAPGETVADVDTTHPHQRALIVNGDLAVSSGTTPRVGPSYEDLVAAAVKDRDAREAESTADTDEATPAQTAKETGR